MSYGNNNISASKLAVPQPSQREIEGAVARLENQAGYLAEVVSRLATRTESVTVPDAPCETSANCKECAGTILGQRLSIVSDLISVSTSRIEDIIRRIEL